MTTARNVGSRLRRIEKEIACLREAQRLLLITGREPGKYPYYEWRLGLEVFDEINDLIVFALGIMDDRLSGRRRTLDAGRLRRRLMAGIDGWAGAEKPLGGRFVELLSQPGVPTFDHATAVVSAAFCIFGPAGLARQGMVRMLSAMYSQGVLRDLCRHLLRDAGVRPPRARRKSQKA